MDCAHLGGRWAWGLDHLTDDLRALDSSGRWAVVLPFDGAPVLARFRHWSVERPEHLAFGPWKGPPVDAWTSSMSQEAYQDAVERTRDVIAAGGVYQANVCRVLHAPLGPECDLAGLHSLLLADHPAPHAGFVRVAEAGVDVVSASPERFLGRHGDALTSSPIKGTGRTAVDLQPKDEAENVMIVDLVRNDLSRVCRPGSVQVPALLRLESHPGLVHLVSDVVGVLSDGVGWPQVVQATFPPGSVTGAPKTAALRLIDALESRSRHLYCGAIGWVDADRATASLAVAIRTFWREGDDLCFGTGAGITWGSDALLEWNETELKASRLIALAARSWQAGDW